MKTKISSTIYAISVFFMIAFASPSTYAAKFIFSQGGFEDGGFVTGSFEAFDIVGSLNDNGQNIPDGMIDICSGRGCSNQYDDIVTNFSFHFAGNSLFEGLNNVPGVGLTGLLINLKNIGRTELYFGTCDTTCRPFLQYSQDGGIQGFGMPNNPDSFYFSTTEPLLASQVPIPGGLGLFIVGLAWLGAIRRKISA